MKTVLPLTAQIKQHYIISRKGGGSVFEVQYQAWQTYFELKTVNIITADNLGTITVLKWRLPV